MRMEDTPDVIIISTRVIPSTDTLDSFMDCKVKLSVYWGDGVVFGDSDAYLKPPLPWPFPLDGVGVGVGVRRGVGVGVGVAVGVGLLWEPCPQLPLLFWAGVGVGALLLPCPQLPLFWAGVGDGVGDGVGVAKMVGLLSGGVGVGRGVEAAVGEGAGTSAATCGVAVGMGVGVGVAEGAGVGVGVGTGVETTGAITPTSLWGAGFLMIELASSPALLIMLENSRTCSLPSFQSRRRIT